MFSEREIRNTIKKIPRPTLRVKIRDIDALIEAESYYVFPGTAVTVCLLTLKNGYHTHGVSSAISTENFNEELGRMLSYNIAKRKIFELEGYSLVKCKNADVDANHSK